MLLLPLDLDVECWQNLFLALNDEHAAVAIRVWLVNLTVEVLRAQGSCAGFLGIADLASLAPGGDSYLRLMTHDLI